MKSPLALSLAAFLTLPAAAQDLRQWSGASTGAWLTTTNWTPSGTFAGATTAVVAGAGLATDIMAPVATNTATNIGINMNTATGGLGGPGLELAAIDWNKTNATACTIGNSSTTVGGVLKLNGASVNAIDNVFIRVAGSANLTLASANSGTATAAQTLQLVLGNTEGVFLVDAARSLTLNVNGISGAPGTGFALTGGGQFILNAPSTLDGTINLLSGRCQVGNATALGSGPVQITDGAQAYLTASVANSFTIAGNGWTEAAGLLGALRLQGAAVSGSVTLSAPARIGSFNGGAGQINGPLVGSSALEINGPDVNFNGTISINGNASGFSGPISVTQGRLNVGTAQGPTGSVTVADGAALGGESTLGGSLTLGATTGASLFVDRSTPDVLTASGDLTVNGVTTVNLTGEGSSPIRILKTNGTLTATPANFTLVGGLAGYRPGTGFDTTSIPGEVTLNLITQNLLWTGATTADWNGTDANWDLPAETFFQGDQVTFDDSGVAAVNIPGPVIPGKVTVDITTTDRSFAGTGAISGTGQFVKKGSGKLTVSNVNTYTGGTLLQGGMVEVATIGALPGSGGITVSSGTLRVTPILGLAAATTTITLGDANSGSNSAAIEIPSATTADQVTLSTPVILNPAAPVTAKAILRYAGHTASGGAPQFNGPVTLNGRDLWLENTSDSNGNTTRLWNMYGKISGTGNVHVNVDSAGDRVRIGFNGNDFVGDVFIDKGMLQGGNGSGSTSNAIPDSSRIIMSSGTLFGVGVADTIGALVGGASDPLANPPNPARVYPNISTTAVTLTVGGGNMGGTYNGIITNDPINTTTRVLSLTKTGSGTQVMNNDCSFTGTTTISAGKLIFNGGYTSNITVSGGATLGGSGTSTGSITATSAANGGATVAPGNSTGTLSAASANLSTGGILAIEIDDAASPKNDKLAVTGVLNITNARLDVTITGNPGQSVYVIASYGTLTGTFATVNKPANYNLVYSYNDGASSSNIALVQADPYATWAASKNLTALNNAKDADPDGDNVNNALEFYLDGDPLLGDSPGPKASISGSNFVLTYNRRDDAEGETVVAETINSLDAGSWTAAVDGVNGVVITVTENGALPDKIEVFVPIGADTRKSGRLHIFFP